MQTKSYFIFLLASFIIMAVVLWFFCSGRSAVHDNRTRADKVRDELRNAKTTQQEEAGVISETKQSINRSKAAVANSQERIESSEQTNREIADTERADAEIIDECEQILARVRARGGEENQN